VPDNTRILDSDKRNGECLGTSEGIHQVCFVRLSEGSGVDRVNRGVICRLFSTYGVHGMTL
jgi:hypothetical protein